MEYKKISINNYNIHLIKTDKFKKNKIKINFKEETSKKNIVYRNLLSVILLEASKKYNTRRLIEIECENLYNIGIGTNTNASGIYNILNFNASFLNEKYTEEGMFEKSFKFLLEFITNPFIDDNGFDKKTFEMAYNILKEDIESYDDNPGRFAFSRVYELMCPDTPIRYRSVGYMEDLKDITPESLYDYYKTIFDNDIVDIFIGGNIDFDKVISIIKDNFKINNKLESKSHLIKQTSFRDKPLEVIETKPITQSTLILGYKLKDITEYERKYVLTAYNALLGGSPNSKLFKEVREKNSLCYSISSQFSGVSNLEFVVAGINKENYDKTVKLVNEQVLKMSKGDFTEKDLDEVKTMYLSSLKESEDTLNGIMNIYEGREYVNTDLLEERKENFLKVTKEDIINVSKKIIPDLVFLLEGDKKDE